MKRSPPEALLLLAVAGCSADEFIVDGLLTNPAAASAP
jgi:hypothetical protein